MNFYELSSQYFITIFNNRKLMMINFSYDGTDPNQAYISYRGFLTMVATTSVRVSSPAEEDLRTRATKKSKHMRMRVIHRGTL